MHARNAFPFKCKWANHFVKHRFDGGTVHLHTHTHTCALTWKQKQIQTRTTSAISNANHIISYKYIQQKVLFANICDFKLLRYSMQLSIYSWWFHAYACRCKIPCYPYDQWWFLQRFQMFRFSVHHRDSLNREELEFIPDRVLSFAFLK